MKYLALTIALLGSTGCMYQTVDELDIQKGLVLCQPNMGLAEVVEDFTGGTIYFCKNGVRMTESDFKRQFSE